MKLDLPLNSIVFKTHQAPAKTGKSMKSFRLNTKGSNYNSARSRGNKRMSKISSKNRKNNLAYSKNLNKLEKSIGKGDNVYNKFIK
jgi:hypothetical protein